MKLVVPALLFFTAASCLSVVDERWCGPQVPCSQGFVCTSTSHCVRTSGPDGDGGTGGGRNDGGTGGGMGGGFGTGGFAGGGGPGCDAASCRRGCCQGNNCVPVMAQGDGVCGSFGEACKACSFGASCSGGECLPVDFEDAGSPIGGACAQDFQCGSSGTEFCLPADSGFVGGYCSRWCTNQPCPPHAACVAAETTGGNIVNICLATCSGNSCRMGYRCASQGGQGVCLP